MYRFDLYELGVNKKYIKKDNISYLNHPQLIGVIDLLDDKMAYFELYYEGELYIITYDCQFGEMIGYAPMEGLYQDDLYDMYLSEDGNRIEFYGHEYYKNFYIDLTNIYHPSMIIEYQDSENE